VMPPYPIATICTTLGEMVETSAPKSSLNCARPLDAGRGWAAGADGAVRGVGADACADGDSEAACADAGCAAAFDVTAGSSGASISSASISCGREIPSEVTAADYSDVGKKAGCGAAYFHLTIK
jgi:hypothetical protein